MKLRKPSVADKGFTLVELLVVIGILAVLLSVMGPVSLNFYLSYQLDSEAELLTSLLQQARNLAMINKNESSFGVYIGSGSYVLFQGLSYASRTQSQDKTFPRAANITISGNSELVFSSLSGAVASTTLTMSNPSRTRNIYINSEGLIYD